MSVMKDTLFGEIPFSASSTLISSVPMLLVPLTAIFLPARPATDVMCEPLAVSRTRVCGRRVEASARMRNLAPAACAVTYPT